MRKVSILLFATILLFACKTNDKTEPANTSDGEHADWVYDAAI